MSTNLVILVGNLGADPDVRTMQSGEKVSNLSVATSEYWNDKNTGERKEKTEWHRVVIFNKGAVALSEYAKKGSKVYIQGQLKTRSWEQDGQKKYATEIVVNHGGKLDLLDKRDPANQDGVSEPGLHQVAGAPVDQLEDEIPF